MWSWLARTMLVLLIFYFRNIDGSNPVPVCSSSFSKDFAYKAIREFLTGEVLTMMESTYKKPSAAPTVVTTDATNIVMPTVVTTDVNCYNAIVIMDIPKHSPSHYAGSRLLLLSEKGSVSSTYNKNWKWGDSYWNGLATLSKIVPQGPIAIFGLGGGTVAHMLLKLSPERSIHGFEIDASLVEKARVYLGISELETVNEHGGSLQIHIGDAFSNEEDPKDGFAGIVVDLFDHGSVVSALSEPKTWFDIKKRLKPNGRIMVNIIDLPKDFNYEEGLADDFKPFHVLSAMDKAFPGKIQWRPLFQHSHLGLTGPLPNLRTWADIVPKPLRKGVLDWKHFDSLSLPLTSTYDEPSYNEL